MKTLRTSRQPQYIYRFQARNNNLGVTDTQLAASRAEARSKRNRLLSRGFTCEAIERFPVSNWPDLSDWR